MKKITHEVFREFKHKFYIEKDYPHERFGQAFMNHVSEMKDVQDNELFFVENAFKVECIIWEKYLEVGS